MQVRIGIRHLGYNIILIGDRTLGLQYMPPWRSDIGKNMLEWGSKCWGYKICMAVAAWIQNMPGYNQKHWGVYDRLPHKNVHTAARVIILDVVR